MEIKGEMGIRGEGRGDKGGAGTEGLGGYGKKMRDDRKNKRDEVNSEMGRRG